MLRHVCTVCDTIHYRNPRLVVGSLPEWGDRILLCRRAIEPSYGKWTLPAGFMEVGETVANAAIRETSEEACARIALDQLFSIISVPHIDQVHVIYRAQLLDLDFSAGVETLELRLFSEDEIPWDDIAFRTIHLTLRHYFADRRKGRFEFHEESISPPLSPQQGTREGKHGRRSREHLNQISKPCFSNHRSDQTPPARQAKTPCLAKHPAQAHVLHLPQS